MIELETSGRIGVAHQLAHRDQMTNRVQWPGFMPFRFGMDVQRAQSSQQLPIEVV
jgi:hypothetical protein